MKRREKVYKYEREAIYSFRVFLFLRNSSFEELRSGEKEKLFREYQCFCARNGYAYESPKVYGLRGLFG